MNVVKVLMIANKPCAEWIHLHGLMREHFIHDLNPIQGIKYDDSSGGNIKQMDYKNSIISDQIEEYDAIHEDELNHHKKTVELCKLYLTRVKPQYKSLIRDWMNSQSSYQKLGEIHQWSKTRVEQIINEETLRISTERLDFSSKIT